MSIFRTWYNTFMRMNKDGSPDKRFKVSNTDELNETIGGDGRDGELMIKEDIDSLVQDSIDTFKGFENSSDKTLDVETSRTVIVKNNDGTQSLVDDPNDLHERLLRQHNLQLDFDVVEGTISTKHGFIKLDKPTLVVKATYGERK